MIKSPEKKPKASAQPKLDGKKTIEENKTEDPDKKQNDPLYWPMKPGGPIK